ncbi:MAG: hypothetical protein JWN92_2322, partial [Candidatus Acidoferrum typicum]|nr:hypothetical protein [Candidatus Acidoferrum typicum]
MRYADVLFNTSLYLPPIPLSEDSLTMAYSFQQRTDSSLSKFLCAGR